MTLHVSIDTQLLKIRPGAAGMSGRKACRTNLVLYTILVQYVPHGTGVPVKIKTAGVYLFI